MSFLQFLITMSFHYKHQDVLDTYFEVHMAWQNKQFEWNDPWPILDERLKGIRSRSIMIPQSHTTKKGNQPQSPGNHGAGAPAPKKQGKPDINGVPRSYMQSNHICMNFNNGEACNGKDSHKNKYNEKVTLQHICAGCNAKDVSKSEHPVFGCQKHNFAYLF